MKEYQKFIWRIHNLNYFEVAHEDNREEVSDIVYVRIHQLKQHTSHHMAARFNFVILHNSQPLTTKWWQKPSAPGLEPIPLQAQLKWTMKSL